MTTIVDGQAGITFNDASVQGTAGYTGFRNRIINGDMRIDQRNAGASITQDTTNAQFSCDRWNIGGTVASKFTAQQNAGAVTPPAGFNYYLGITSASAFTVGSSDYFYMGQGIEGYNMADWAWGTSNAKSITISFYVYSSLTGVFGGVLCNNGASRNYPFSYTISAANNWTSVSLTVPGDTAGTWLTTNGGGLYFRPALGAGATVSGTAGAWYGTTYRSAAGAVSVVGTSGATWYITGVQIELGGVVTPFERRNFGIELAMCQRYYQSSYPQGTAAGSADGNGINFVATGTNRLVGASSLAVVMRAAPNAVIYDPGAANTTNQVRNQSNGAVAVTGTAFNSNTTYALTRVITFSGTPFTAGQDYNFHYTAAAEL